jgi:hypothetical protein
MKMPVWKTLVVLVIVCCASSFAFGQTPIFSDDFETGEDDASLDTVGNYLTVTGGGGPDPSFQTDNNPFPTGSLYARMYDPDTTVGPRFITSDTAGTDGRGPMITGQVTTFSFDFWEPDVLEMYSAGISFGYTAQDDLNSGERTWRAFLVDGLLNPNGSNEGAAINYTKQTVNTIWMIANDSATAIENYRDGQTLDPSDADVWISMAGADPVFAFALNRQNAAQGPHGIGFRSFSGDIGEVLIDNMLLMPGATFDRDAFTPSPRLNLLVDRDNGQVRIENNTDQSMAISGYRIISDGGASLDETGWNPIANQSLPGFPAGDGSGNGWEVGSNSDDGELREYYLQNESTLNTGEFISLGAAYNTNVDAMDLRFEYVLDADTVAVGPVVAGTIAAGGVPGDYNGNGIVDAADFTVWRDHLGQTFQLTNEDPDNLDGQVTSADYDFWKAHFGESGAGSGALANTGVPEPATVWLLLIAAQASCCRRSGAGRHIRQ